LSPCHPPSRGSVPQIRPPCEEISHDGTHLDPPPVRPPAPAPCHLVTVSPCHRVIRSARYPAAPLLGPTDTAHTDEASDGSEGFIEGAGI